MHRAGLLEKLHSHQPGTPQEKNVLNTIRTFVQNSSDCFERSNTEGHITASAWVINKKRTHALLTHHKKLNKWLQLGGHTDGNTDVFDAAKQEIREESGLQNAEVLLEEKIFDLDVHEIPQYKGVPAHVHYDIRFLFEADMSEEVVISDESFDVVWIVFDKIEKLRTDDSVIRMNNKVMKLIKDGMV